MKKKRNAFTFVELIAVITIIGVLSLITIPIMDKIIKEGKEEVYQKQLDYIVLSLKNWASENKEYLPENNGDVLMLTLGALKSEGHMEYEIKNPKSNKCFDNNMVLKIVRNQKNYDYSIDLDTINDSESCEVAFENPIIVLRGNSIEFVEVNSVYNDLGVIAKDKEGNDITSSVRKTVTGSGNSIDTSKLNNQYIITYAVSANGKTTTASRTIKIVDTTKPDLVIPANTTISVETTIFDLMQGVSVSDNSGEEINVKVTGSINFGVLGMYTITYTATDSSGNSKVLKRIITVS